MRALVWMSGAAALAIGAPMVFAQGGPENLLPPGFDKPVPSPSPTRARAPAPTPAPATVRAAAPTPQPAATQAGEIVQPLPSSATAGNIVDLSQIPTLDQLEKMSTDQLDDLFGLKPKVDIPAAAQRSMARVGVIAPQEGGLPVFSLAHQPAALVRAAIEGIKGPLVSRWGHILLRRALASRLEAPSGMDPAEFAALRAGLLNRMGEFAVARALVQDVDTANYTTPLSDAALAAYLGTSDILGACPAVRLSREGSAADEWRMLAAICSAYAGEQARGEADLRRIMNGGKVPRIDVLLARRFAGAAGSQNRSVTIEWDGVDQLNPWRFSLANALGESVPQSLLDGAGRYYRLARAIGPMFDPAARAADAEFAARTGVFSSAALVDLYSQIYAEEEGAGGQNAPDATAQALRTAYAGESPSQRLSAIKSLWGDGIGNDFGRYVLTAYAAARLSPSSEMSSDAGNLIASMLTAGLDRDAMRWAGVVKGGSEGWALLVLAQPGGQPMASDSELSDFLGNDGSTGQQRSRLLVAGLAGLGRIGDGNLREYSHKLNFDLGRQTRWTRAIDAAAAVNNQALVALLVGLGMQGDSWSQMTPLYLYHIVRSLNSVGMSAEARMIAAEAVSRA